jgi:hypothetical protein
MDEKEMEWKGYFFEGVIAYTIIRRTKKIVGMSN